jgi:hypothetical protein
MSVHEIATNIVLFGTAGGILYKIGAWLLSLWRQRKSKIAEDNLDKELSDYYRSLGEHANATKRFEIYTVLSLRGLLNLKHENLGLNIVNRLFFVAFCAFFLSILSRLSETSTRVQQIAETVLSFEGIGAFIAAVVLGEIVDKRIDRNNLKISKYLETASKDLLDDKYK